MDLGLFFCYATEGVMFADLLSPRVEEEVAMMASPDETFLSKRLTLWFFKSTTLMKFSCSTFILED